MRIILPLLFCLAISNSCLSQEANFTVHFDFDKDEIIPADTILLNNFLKARISEDEVADYNIYGHTDSKGSAAYNLALSRRRVQAVTKYLKAGPFGPGALNVHYLGESKPLFANDDDLDKSAQNRRVEIIFTTINKKWLADAANPTKREPSIEQIIKDTVTKVGSRIVFKNLEFEGGRHVLLSSSVPQLESLLAALRSNPSLKIAIEGHICCIEGKGDGLDFDTDEYDLSYQRAKAVYDYLVLNGIDNKRLKYKGFGHLAPIFAYPEKDSVQQIANRRVEIAILEK
jgi:outer membrane protein OmpA-like peptidoglycan-associated protein